MKPDPQRFTTGLGLGLIAVGFLGTKWIVDNVSRESRNVAALAFGGTLYAIYVVALWWMSRKDRRREQASASGEAAPFRPQEARRERRLLMLLAIPILLLVLCALVDKKAMMLVGGFLILPAMIAAHMLAYRDEDKR